MCGGTAEGRPAVGSRQSAGRNKAQRLRRWEAAGLNRGAQLGPAKSEISEIIAKSQGIFFTPIGGVTVSTGSLAAKRHAGVWAPVIAWKTIIANTNQLAYAA